MPPDHPDRCILTRLPAELLASISARLANSDIKALRAANRAINKIVPLRLSRVFLSANSLNIKVFRSIADDDVFRQRVTDIVWDDARLIDNDHGDSSQGLLRSQQFPGNDPPQWFSRGRQRSLNWHFNIVDCGGNGNTIPDDVMSLNECWRYYKSLLQDQNSVLDSGSDAEALKYGIARFPSLKRITLTPSAHGVMGGPLYETPMIRAFPKDFAYPMPRGWPDAEYPLPPVEVFPWQDSSGSSEHQRLYGTDCTMEEYRNIWRGFRILLRTLAQSDDHQVSEFIVATHHIFTGINCHIFDQACQEYVDLATLLSRQGFRRLDLALSTGDIELDDWSPLCGGLFREMLATELEHVSLSSTMGIDAGGMPVYAADPEDIEEQLCLPLQTIFPIEKWPSLQHFGITKFLVRQSELVELLAALPSSLRSVELSYLAFFEEDASYMTLLRDMRDKLSWRDRYPYQRPRVTIRLHREMSYRMGQYVCVDRAAERFLYGDITDTDGCPNPFGERYGGSPVEGLGAVDRDYLEPSLERPYNRSGV